MAYQVQRLEEFLALPEPYRCATCPYCNGERDPTPKHPKPDPWTWWESLGKPKYAVAPMVDQSELPFRMLCRKYGATLAYTPMFHSGNFAQSAEYRRREFSTCPEDRPLFAQFCGHDADTVLAATRHIDDPALVDAVDLNLGCPQGIAKKGFYGAFLMERWDVIHTILHTLVVELRVPVTAKMRLFDDEALTLRYARMLRDTGIQLLAVHGRTREMKGQQTGIADMEMVRRVKAEITNIPVLANGNVLSYADLTPNLALTGCEGILSAEGLLWDPRLFSNPQRPVLTGRGHCADRLTRIDAIATAKEYLEYVRKFPVDSNFAKAHIFKIVHHSLEVHPTFRVSLGDSGTQPRSDMIAEMMAVVDGLAAAELACDVDVYQKQPKREGQAATECAVGCRPQAAPADYEAAVDENFASLFDS